jgi:hypothetical protein
MPLITTQSAKGYGWGSLVAAGNVQSYESIATVTGNGSANTLTISSIPSTYQHLQIRVIARDTRSTANDTMQMYFNSDTAPSAPSNYTRHALRGTSAPAATAYSVVQNALENVGVLVGAADNTLTSVMGVAVVDILDYANTNKFKTVRSLAGVDANASGSFIEIISSLWSSTSAINSITFINNGSSAFTSTTQFALYGIKG